MLTAVFPGDTGLPLFFDGSPEVGLGLYRSKIGANLGEYGTLVLGAVIYVLTLKRLRKEKGLRAQPKGASS